MAGITTNFEGLEKELEQLADKVVPIAKQAVYQGAGLIADQMTAEIRSLRTESNDRAWGTERNKRLLLPVEKEALINAAKGIAKMHEDGFEVGTVVGMANSGYAEINGRTVPVPVIARSCDSGTSFMVKQPFMRRAISATKNPASAMMRDFIDKRFKELLGG